MVQNMLSTEELVPMASRDDRRGLNASARGYKWFDPTVMPVVFEQQSHPIIKTFG